MHPELSVDHLVLAGAALLAAGILVRRLADRLQVPGLLLFLGLGMAIGRGGLGWVRFDQAALAQNLSVVALVLILFEGGISSSPTLVRRVVAPASVLATFGVAVTAGIVGAAATFLLHVPLNTGLLVGAVAASTDAAAVFSVLRRTPVPARLAALLEMESGLNDPMAVLLTIGLLATQRGGTTAADWLIFGSRQIAGGLAVGIVVGLVGSRVLVRTNTGASSAAPLVGLATAAGCYGLAAWLGGSGFLAVFVGGILFGSLAPAGGRGTEEFHAGLASLAQLSLFLMLGLLVKPSELGGVAWKALAIAGVLVFVARPIAVAASLAWFRTDLREMAFVSWAGLRGAVPIVLATFALTAGERNATLVFDVVFFVVLVSTLVQGSTVSLAARRLGLHAEPSRFNPIIDIVPMDQFGLDLIELEVAHGAPIAGKAVHELGMPAKSRIVTIVRVGHVVVPSGSTVLQDGDHLTIAAPRSRTTRDALAVWAGTEADPAEG